MDNLKIRVNSEDEYTQASDLFKELGYKLHKFASHGVGWFCAFDDGSCGGSRIAKNINECKEITFLELKDLVFLHRNDVSDATHVATCGTKLYLDSSGNYHHFSNAAGVFYLIDGDLEYYVDLPIKPIQKPQTHPEVDTDLISGADAFKDNNDLYQDIVDSVRHHGKASVSHIQRVFHLRHKEAADFMDRMESEFIVSPMSTNGHRDVYLPDIEETIKSLKAEITDLKQQLARYENKWFFSHDFNGDGFKYHKTLMEAQKEAEANLDYYRDRVAEGHHVESDGEFNELCYGVVLASADYNVDDVVTEEHHKNEEWTQYKVGTEILSLALYEEPRAMIEAAQENKQ